MKLTEYVSVAAVHGALCSMQQAGGAWIGAAYWAAGPWWGDVRFSHANIEMFRYSRLSLTVLPVHRASQRPFYLVDSSSSLGAIPVTIV